MDCKYWTPVSLKFPKGGGCSNRMSGGICENSKLTEDYGQYPQDGLVYPYIEGGYFWTGPLFGCVLHEKKS